MDTPGNAPLCIHWALKHWMTLNHHAFMHHRGAQPSWKFGLSLILMLLGSENIYVCKLSSVQVKFQLKMLRNSIANLLVKVSWRQKPTVTCCSVSWWNFVPLNLQPYNSRHRFPRHNSIIDPMLLPTIRANWIMNHFVKPILWATGTL